LIRIFSITIKFLQIVLKSKDELILENPALRHQLTIYQTKKSKPKISDVDRSFWISLKKAWNKWMDHLIIVKPETIIDWQTSD
jgi:putative transposase